MKSKVIVFPEPLKAVLDEIEIPKPGKSQIVTKTLYTGVSTGTETRVFVGKQDGSQFPLIPGYENVGEIVEAGEDVSLPIGTIVYAGQSSFSGKFNSCWGAQVEYSLVDANNVIPVPKRTDPIKALYSKVGGIALHGVKRGRVCDKDTVAVVGLGLIGHMAVQNAKAFGAQVIAIDMDEQRLDLAQKANADFIINAKEENAHEKVMDISNGGVDVAIDVTGIADTVDSTAQLVYGKPWAPPYPPSARVVILGSYTDPIKLDYTDTLFMNEPDILPSRDTTAEDMKEMLALIHQKRVDPGIIPANVFKVEKAPEAYQFLLKEKPMRICFDWR